jgi:cyclase
MRDGRLVKGRCFARERYIGDSLNTVRIFNEKEADELILLDIGATPAGRPPDFGRLADLASECFMPLCYGGGITDLAQIEAILRLGIEKVCLGSAAVRNPELVRSASQVFGAQSIVVCLDVRRNWWRGEHLVFEHGSRRFPGRPEDLLRRLEDAGAGEAIVQSVDRDGTMAGYDLELIRRLSSQVDIPVVALGGAGCLEDLASVLRAGAAAAAAGSLFVFHGPHRAVLVNYPSPEKIDRLATGVEQ